MTIDDEIGSGRQAIIQTAQLPESKQPPTVVAGREINTKTKPTLTREAVEGFSLKPTPWRTIDVRKRNKYRWENSERITGIITTGDEGVAMEYMNGDDLVARSEKYPNDLPLREALWLGQKVCQGLEVASARKS